MNESWPTMMTMNTSMLAPGKPPEEVSAVELNSLLKGRKFGVKKEDVPFDMCPPSPLYDIEEMQELEQYCKTRGIIGVNLNGMNPRAILRMLKNRMGDKTPINETKKEILYG
jgi:hypothetical protein